MMVVFNILTFLNGGGGSLMFNCTEINNNIINFKSKKSHGTFEYLVLTNEDSCKLSSFLI